MRNDKIQTIAYMGLYAALFVVLWYVGQFIPFLKMPDGGSIELEFAALFVASFHLGWKKGLVVALISWLLEFMFGGANYFLSPMQYFLDYLCAFAAVQLLHRHGCFHAAEVAEQCAFRCLFLFPGRKCSRFKSCLGEFCCL